MPLTRTRTATTGSIERGGSSRSGTRARAAATSASAALLSAVCTATLLTAAAPASATAPATPPARPTPPTAQTRADRIPLPYRMADTGGGDQLITARAPRKGSTTGTVKWWQRRNGRWHQAGSAPARFGSGGLTEGSTRVQGTSTTPTGLYDLPFAFGIAPAPDGTTTPYRRVGPDSWWCEDNASTSYNRWVEPRPRDCAAAESERLADYPTQYSRALVTGFNYHRPVHRRGAGIFLHVNGKGATAGCVSVPASAMARILSWVRPSEHPHIAIGTAHGPTAITRY